MKEKPFYDSLMLILTAVVTAYLRIKSVTTIPESQEVLERKEPNRVRMMKSQSLHKTGNRNAAMVGHCHPCSDQIYYLPCELGNSGEILLASHMSAIPGGLSLHV